MVRYSLLIFFSLYLIVLEIQAQEQPAVNVSKQNTLTEEIQTVLVNLPHLSGKPILPSDFKDKVVVITFFASWCPPCRVELNHLKKLYASSHAQGLEVIAINRFEDFDNFSNDKRLQKFLNKLSLEFPVLKGNEVISEKLGNITRIPTVFIFDRKGEQVRKFFNQGGANTSSLGLEELENTVTALLSSNSVNKKEKSRDIQWQAAYWKTPIPFQGPPPKEYHVLAQGISAKNCASCHVDKFQEWTASLHGEAMGAGVLGQYPHFNASSIAQCNTCHAPMSEQWQYLQKVNRGWQENSQFDQALLKEGISCAACHLRNHQRNAPPLRKGKITVSQALHGNPLRSSFFEDSTFCKECHQHQSGPKPGGKFVQNTYLEWQQSPAFQKGQTCQSCHMPDRKHLWKGIHDKEMTASGVTVDYTSNLEAPTAGNLFKTSLTLTNTGTGHMFPTYTTPAVFMKAAFLDKSGRAIPGYYEEKIIQRRLNMSTYPWTEYFDTRLAPGESTTLQFERKIPSNAKSLKLWVWVEPDHFYEGFYRTTLRNSSNHKGRILLEKALQKTLERQYSLFSRTIRF